MKYMTVIDKINEESSNDAYIVWTFDKKCQFLLQV